METLGNRFKKLRGERGVSISEVAKKVGVSPSTYRDWEYGREIKGEPNQSICDVYSVTLSYLITGKEVKFEEPLREIEKQVKIIRSFL